MDFVVENKVVAELKAGCKLRLPHIKQVFGYLNAARLKLAIIIYFCRDGVRSERIINPNI
ncbi:GxxExxY protein [Patescibacteria group bacterium]|nr:GxxExxY protein [Patescibacteria group bacterium]